MPVKAPSHRMLTLNEHFEALHHLKTLASMGWSHNGKHSKDCHYCCHNITIDSHASDCAYVAAQEFLERIK